MFEPSKDNVQTEKHYNNDDDDNQTYSFSRD